MQTQESPNEEDLVDNAARSLLNISGEEFRRGWEAGKYADDPDPRVMNVAVLLAS